MSLRKSLSLMALMGLLAAQSAQAKVHYMRTQTTSALFTPMQIVPTQSQSLQTDSLKALAAIGITSFQLNYYGGPVLDTVKIIGVYWGNQVDATVQSQMGDFYSTFVASPMVDFLTEYNTTGVTTNGHSATNQSIGHGSYGGDFVITPQNTSTGLADADVQTEIQTQIDAGNLPPADSNSLYMVHFPPGVNITMSDGSASCQDFCAYHSNYHDSNNQAVFYGVLPDFTQGSCTQGCGSGSNFDNFTTTASHEVTEAMTDSLIGDVTGSSIDYPAAWYDPVNNMEIGDICAYKSQGSIVSPATQQTFAVQGEWSNSRNACYAGN